MFKGKVSHEALIDWAKANRMPLIYQQFDGASGRDPLFAPPKGVRVASSIGRSKSGFVVRIDFAPEISSEELGTLYVGVVLR